MLINYRSIGIFEEKKWNRKKHEQCKKSGNYQHLNKSDILDNSNGNANKVII